MTDTDKKKIILLGQLSEFKELLSEIISGLSNKVEALETLIEGDSDGVINKFNEIVAFLNEITDDKTLKGIIGDISTQISAKYTKPEGGIPKTDLTSEIQTSLEKADSALQRHQDISGKVDKVVGKELSTNDYTNADKAKVDALIYATTADIEELFSS